MGQDDRFRSATENLTGKTRAATGRTTDDEEREAEGTGQRTRARIERTGDDVKDAVS